MVHLEALESEVTVLQGIAPNRIIFRLGNLMTDEGAWTDIDYPQFRFTVSIPYDRSYDLCIYDMRYSLSLTDLTTLNSTENWDSNYWLDLKNTSFLTDAKIMYECGPGQVFEHTRALSFNMTCLDTGKWDWSDPSPQCFCKPCM